MKIDMHPSNPTIDASDLAEAFETTPEQVQALMRDGSMTSRFETGVGEDTGTHRLTFWYGGKRVRYTCDAEGLVLKRSRVKTGARP
ncbi:hypothetical protein KO498_05415 [Lentibacter algarum]|uniref:DUF6522 family protein n=1 Tax=Lentibacter algarum TaxID=576131 RepID=UPI001C06B8FF|nr:DUF6522 family protein [Lentibacter algarum]MBU2981246.1 hypothetical protein [Lentibacter algarum]